MKMPRYRQSQHGHSQRGVALIVGMVLLVILTLLAISGMNTATTELIMAGNEQYQSRAFQAAETGIERTISTGVFNPAAVQDPPVVTLPPPVAGQAADTFDTMTRPRGPSAAPPGYTLGEFSTEHFEIESTGESLRNASSTNVQGLYLVVPSPN